MLRKAQNPPAASCLAADAARGSDTCIIAPRLTSDNLPAGRGRKSTRGRSHALACTVSGPTGDVPDVDAPLDLGGVRVVVTVQAGPEPASVLVAGRLRTLTEVHRLHYSRALECTVWAACDDAGAVYILENDLVGGDWWMLMGRSRQRWRTKVRALGWGRPAGKEVRS